MIREAIGVGETEVLALEDAKRQLGIDESEIVEFEVIQRAEKKKFGLFGGAPAKVKITLKAGPAETAEEFLSNVLKNMKLESVSINKISRTGELPQSFPRCVAGGSRRPAHGADRQCEDTPVPYDLAGTLLGDVR